ncbi:hypothetical protein IGI04_016664, partial [Brassica rapa subsp. trilocularis]
VIDTSDDTSFLFPSTTPLPKSYCFRFVFSSEPLFDPASASVISSTSVPDDNSDLNHEVFPGMETVSSISLKAHQSSSDCSNLARSSSPSFPYHVFREWVLCQEIVDLIRFIFGGFICLWICKVGNFMIWAIYRYVRRNHYRPLHLLRKKASPTPWFSQIPLFSTRYTETNLEEQWRLPRYHFPNRSPCIAVEPLSHASPFWEDMKVKKDCEFKDMTCRFWMITSPSPKHIQTTS